MGEYTLNIIVIVITVIMIIVGTIIYNDSPRLHNCGSCSKYLDIKAKRYWYQLNGKEVPFCSRCHKKHR